MKTSENIVEIAKALAEFQANVQQPEKDGKNPHFRSSYVTLDGTVKAIQDGVGVVTIIFHTSGQFIEFEPFILPLDKKTAQGVGSALTYSKRYALSAAFGIVSDVDDDGNEATANAPTAKPISSKQVGLIKMQVKKIATNKSINDAEVYQKLGVADVTQLSSQQASRAIETLNKWVDQLEKQGA